MKTREVIIKLTEEDDAFTNQKLIIELLMDIRGLLLIKS